jgi:hypothetical protein
MSTVTEVIAKKKVWTDEEFITLPQEGHHYTLPVADLFQNPIWPENQLPQL